MNRRIVITRVNDFSYARRHDVEAIIVALDPTAVHHGFGDWEVADDADAVALMVLAGAKLG